MACRTAPSRASWARGRQEHRVLEILTLVAASRGICLVPTAVARHYPRSDIAYVPLEDAEPAVVSLARRPGSVIAPLAAFIETVREVAARPGTGPSARDRSD